MARQALARASVTAAEVAALGVTNQRETTILWDRHTGRPVANAIVWQSRASAAICDRLKADGLEDTFRAKTGLLLDAYFSGTQDQATCWIRHDGLRSRALRGDILFGTVDTWLLWRLTGGRRHVTDCQQRQPHAAVQHPHARLGRRVAPACSTFRGRCCPEVRPSSEVYGTTAARAWFGGPIPIAGDAGDQQAATFGQACFTPGMAKNTYGTGCFLLLNTGPQPIASRHRLLTTIGWGLAAG